jgi:L-ascorbate metabolism protein UlaG (beta-lactamase superfamily)
MRYKLLLAIMILLGLSSYSQEGLQLDVIKTNNGDLNIYFLGHGSVMFTYNDQTIYVDPSSSSGQNFTNLPKADLVLITHSHGDHLDKSTLELIVTKDTKYLSNEVSNQQLQKGKSIKNNESGILGGLKVEAVAAYNIEHKRSSGQAYHPKGQGNGYVINFGDKRVYLAGDTEDIPEMADLKNIDIAFLPMNIPYTMTPEMAKKAALLFKPKVIYPYHYRGTDPMELKKLLNDYPEIEVKIRKM